MSEKNKEIQEDQELIKALEDLGIDPSTLDLVSKSEEKEKEEDTEEKEEDESEESSGEGEYSKMKSDYDKLSKACSMKKAEMEEYEKKMKSKKAEKSEESELEKSEEEKVEKSADSSELIKSMLDEKLSLFNDLVKGLEDKIGNLTDENSELKKSIDLLGEERPGKKSVNSEFSIIEKGGQIEDETGKKVLSVSRQKDLVCAELEKAMDETEGELQKAVASQIVAYNADPNGRIAQPIAAHLYNARNVRLVK